MGYIVDGARHRMICPLYFDPLMNSVYSKKNVFFFNEEWELAIFIDVYMGSYLENNWNYY